MIPFLSIALGEVINLAHIRSIKMVRGKWILVGETPDRWVIEDKRDKQTLLNILKLEVEDGK